MSSCIVYADTTPLQTKNPELEGSGASSSAASGGALFPRCVGGDLERLEDTAMRRCLRFKDQFEQYAASNGLTAMGIDTLLLFITARYENGCCSIAAGDECGAEGGIMQVDYPCLCSVRHLSMECPVPYTPEHRYCDTVGKEIDEGLKELKNNFEKVISRSDLRGREALWMAWFAYNRGNNAAWRAMKSMQEKGMTIQEACDEACDHLYSGRDRQCDAATQKNYGCPPGNNPMCENGKTCSYNFWCRIKHPEVGIHYSDIRWVEYVRLCEQIGGHIVDEGAPLDLPPGAAAAFREAAAGGGISSAPRMEHPYFSVPYSVNPSFSTSIPYDFSIYDALPGYLHRVERCKDDIDCIAGNISIIEQENHGFDWIVQYGGNILSRDSNGILEYAKWQAFCETPEQHAVNSLAEAIDNCAKSQDRDCICSYMLPISEAQEHAWWEGMFGGFSSSSADILGLMPFSSNRGDDWEARVLGLSKIGRRLTVSLVPRGGSTNQVVQGVDFKRVDPALDPEGNIDSLITALIRSATRTFSDLLGYTHDDFGKTLHIYKDSHNNITIYPQHGAPTEKVCSVHNKMVKLCVIQNSSFMAYNQQENRMGLQRLVLKFAYLFRSQITDVRNFEVRDLKFASNTSLLVWDPVDGVDVNFYTVYRSDDPGTEANLRGKAPADLGQELRDRLYAIPPLQLDPAAKQPIMMSLSSIERPMCTVFSGSDCTRVYALTSVGEAPPPEMIYQDTLYYSGVDNKFFYILPGLENGKRYFFGITATDTNGDESPSFNIPEAAKNSPSVDDVPPGLASVQGLSLDGDQVRITIVPVTRNVDGSLMDSPATGYKLYCFESSASGEFDLSSRERVAFLNAAVSDPSVPVELVVDADQFNVFSCGFVQSPQLAKVVVAGVKRVGGAEVDCGSPGHACNITDGAFSSQFVDIPVI
ncbi:hypothetical protein JW898_01255 [Candidatus Woesearchaeota archaeon]|nr:hypothetical protein [Candidatus Woesearchaeota archaeon]